ncbi:unnamed protein product [Cuscuta epithymum]|uniref:Uncharacterized protein n=1 Tax=Cuscuta epithymum TaxID=186058 RepID=A0AAV0C730_9ASTE|nr:unnamed protein product [Cuscuta epithymum]
MGSGRLRGEGSEDKRGLRSWEGGAGEGCRVLVKEKGKGDDCRGGQRRPGGEGMGWCWSPAVAEWGAGELGRGLGSRWGGIYWTWQWWLPAVPDVVVVGGCRW